MIVRSRVLRGVCLLALTVAMNGCGDDDTPLAPQGQSGRLVQGPVLDATVFADNVSGGIRFTLDADEVSTTTSSTTGDFTLPTVPGYNYILVSKGGTDKLTGLNAIQMIAPAGSANITPLTTLVALDTTGTVQAKLEALMPAGVKFDADLSTSASPAILLVSKSVENVVQAMTSAVTTKAGAGVITASQLSVIQAQTMQAIAVQFASSTTSLSVPANLSTTLQAAATTAATDIHTSNANITIPAATATQIVTDSVAATVTALSSVSVGGTFAATAVTGGETTALATTGAALAVAVTAAGTSAATSTGMVATPVVGTYIPPVITVVTPITVNPPVNTTGATGGNTGGTGVAF